MADRVMGATSQPAQHLLDSGLRAHTGPRGNLVVTWSPNSRGGRLAKAPCGMWLKQERGCALLIKGSVHGAGRGIQGCQAGARNTGVTTCAVGRHARRLNGVSETQRRGRWRLWCDLAVPQPTKTLVRARESKRKYRALAWYHATRSIMAAVGGLDGRDGGEILTVQAGNYANQIGAHYWNNQVRTRPCQRTAITLPLPQQFCQDEFCEPPSRTQFDTPICALYVTLRHFELGEWVQCFC